MMEGLRLAHTSAGRGRINRVILLSDGLANQGITSPHELNRIARQYRQDGVSLTAMGLGLDYNENLMVGLAENGGGNYYFIEHPNQMAHILSKEFDMMSSVVCRNAVIELRVQGGTRVKDVIGSSWTQNGERVLVQLGDLMNDEQRELTVELDVPRGSGSLTIAEGTLGFESDRVKPSSGTFAAAVRYVDDPKVVEKNRDLEVQGKSEVAASTRRVERAMQALDEGRDEDAAAELKGAREALSASPAASAAGAGGDALRSQIGRLDAFKDSVASGDAKKAKKSIQYENYQVQKNKK
jgi:Ca-activated chloride channel family protein